MTASRRDALPPLPAGAMRLDEELVTGYLPRRDADGHKGTFGSLLAVCGSLDYAGAALLAGTAALRAGVGLVTLGLPASLQPLLAGRVPELITLRLPEQEPFAVDAAAAVAIIAGRAHSALLVGPGLAPTEASHALVRMLLAAGAIPAVFDAEALNGLAASGAWWEAPHRPLVLTHPGEFARLDGAASATADADRCSRAAAAAARWDAVVVLKGARTVVAAADGRVAMAAFENAALATAGTGDVLAGTIASLLAQGMEPWQAGCLGVHLHGTAGEHVRERLGDAGLLASDLLPELPRVRRHLVNLHERAAPDRPPFGFAPRGSSGHVALLSVEERLRAVGLPPLPRTAWLEIDTDALASNLAVVRALVPAGTRIAAVVKADGYGHGLEVTARTLRDAGAEVLCVATIDEAMALRASGDRGPVLLLYPVPGTAVLEAARAGIELTIASDDGAAETLAAWRAGRAGASGPGLRVQLEVETGMTRDGVAASAATALFARLAREPGVSVGGLWSHLADPADAAFSAMQASLLEGVRRAIRDAGSSDPMTHLASSGALLAGTAPALSMVRPGLVLYGVVPAGLPLSPEGRRAAEALRPVMSLKARAVRVVEVPVGTVVGYGRTWRAERPSRIATLPLGYGDGYARAAGPGAEALVRGRRVPVVGVISMDSLTIDVTDVPGMGLHDEVVLLGRQGDGFIDATDLARGRNTIAWEVLSGMARRIPRVYDAATGPKGVRLPDGGPQNGEPAIS